MKIEELVIGKWYQPSNYPKYYFLFLGPAKNGIINASYFNKEALCPGTTISNPEFWENAVEKYPTHLEHLMPEELKPKQTYEIF